MSMVKKMTTVKVIHSCDDNPYYLDFWPLVSKVWKEHIGFEPVLIHVSDSSDHIDTRYGQVINIPLDKDLPVHTQAQLARLWYPAQEPDTLWITNDIDMFPMSHQYWNGLVKEWWPSEKPDWTNLNSDGDYFPICYHLALGKNFDTVLGINGDSFSDYVNKNMNEVDENSIHTPENWTGPALSKWNVDEMFSSKKIVEFRNSGGNVYQPKRPPNRRLDRSNWQYDPEVVKQGYYIDCHSIRPYNQYRDEIDKLVNLL
jgi:hypothetical protein